MHEALAYMQWGTDAAAGSWFEERDRVTASKEPAEGLGTGRLINLRAPRDRFSAPSAQDPIDTSYLDTDPQRHKIRLYCLGFYIATALIYLSWRVTAFNDAAPVFSAVFYCAEVYGFAISLLIVFTAWHRKQRDVETPPRHLAVDVFIPTLNEPLHVVRRTALAAVNMDYPHTTWVLDDGNRPEIAAMAAELGCEYRARTSNEGAKAGNLNNGLVDAKGDFVATFDADHVAQRDFLDRLLGYFNDPQVALVQTPQDYFNLDSFQHGRDKRKRLIWSEQSFFHYVGQSGRDHWNAATYCGCSAIIRRSALDEIGGFPTDTVTEDMHAVVKLQKLDHRTVFHPEPLAFGIAPTDFPGYSRQRLRWGEGNMQVCREEGIPFTRSLTLPQRLCYFALTTNYLDCWQKTVYYLTPVIVLFAQVPPIWSNPWVFLGFFAPYLLATYLYFEEFGRGFGNIFATEVYAMARLGAGLVSTLGLVRKNIRFRVSSKTLQGHLPLKLLMPQTLVLTASAAAVLYTVLRPYFDQPLHMPLGITVIISVLALYHCALAGWVLINAWRASREAPTQYQHCITLPLELTDSHGDTHLVELEELSADRFTFCADRGAFIDVGSQYSGRLFLPDGDELCLVNVTGRSSDGPRDTRRINCTVQWPDRSARDRVELALHAGRWYRPVMGYHEAIATPFELLRRLFAKGDGTPHAKLRWMPAVLRPADKPQATSRLCFVARDEQHHRRYLLTFGSRQEGGAVDVTPAGKQPEFARRFRVGEPRNGVLPDAAALAVVGGRIFDLAAEEAETLAAVPKVKQAS